MNPYLQIFFEIDSGISVVDTQQDLLWHEGFSYCLRTCQADQPSTRGDTLLAVPAPLLPSVTLLCQRLSLCLFGSHSQNNFRFGASFCIQVNGMPPPDEAFKVISHYDKREKSPRATRLKGKSELFSRKNTGCVQPWSLQLCTALVLLDVSPTEQQLLTLIFSKETQHLNSCWGFGYENVILLK